MNKPTIDDQRSGGWPGWAMSLPPIILAACAGVAAWAVFRPGFMDSDTCQHMNQATSGHYDDWFSPFVPLALRWAIKFGGGLSTATLCQAVFLAVGVFGLASELFRLFASEHRPAWHSRWAALVVLAILLVPFSPLIYYFCHYKNDSLMAGFLTWAVAFWLKVDRIDIRCQRPVARVQWMTALAMALACTIGTVVVRYNGVVLLPVFLLIAVLVVGRASRTSAIVAACVILVGPVVAHRALLWVTHAEERQPARQLMALELVGMCIERDDLKPKLPYTSSFLIEERYRGGYQPGIVTRVMEWGPENERIVKSGYVWNDYSTLAREYRRAIWMAPGTWLIVKAKAAIASLFDQTPWWHRSEITPNDYGLRFADDFRGIRSVLAEIDTAIWNDPILRFLCARHLPWVVLDVAFLGFASVAAAMSRTRRAIWIAMILWLAFAHYCSHLMAVTVHDYRFMYPATLMVQILATCCLLGSAWGCVQAYARAQPRSDRGLRHRGTEAAIEVDARSTTLAGMSSSARGVTARADYAHRSG